MNDGVYIRFIVNADCIQMEMKDDTAGENEMPTIEGDDEVCFLDLTGKSIFTPYPSVHIHCALTPPLPPHRHHITNHRSLAMR